LLWKSHYVDILKGEQFQPYFLTLNPKAVDEELHPACSAITYIVSHRHTLLRQGVRRFEDFLARGAVEGRATRTLKWQWIQQGIQAPGAAEKIQLCKLNNLPAITENFIGWGIPFPHILTPFVSGVEFFGGLFLVLGLLTRISAGALGITMIVAIKSAKWADVDSLETLLGFDETEYLALFLWLAIAGAGPISIDRLLWRSQGHLKKGAITYVSGDAQQ
jgi:putative oxidoreductase